MNPIDTDLIGTWFISDIGIIPHEDGMLVLRTDGICIQFPCSVSRPQLSQTFRLCYSIPDTNTIQFKMKPDGKEWFRYIERTDTGWTMICDEELSKIRYFKKFPCRIAKPDELPAWFDEMIEANLVLMAALVDNKTPAKQAAPEQPLPATSLT